MDPLDMNDIKQILGELVLQVYQRDKALREQAAAPVAKRPRKSAPTDG